MAIMYPPECSSETKSNAEKKIFDLFKRETADDHIVLHSLGLANHRFKPWAEIDFVVIAPTGVYCIEVKGGRIERRNGRWYYTNREGRTFEKNQGPFEQVGPASAALRNFLIDSDPTLWDIPVGYGVMTPDVKFQITAADVILEVVYDERSAEYPLDDYLNKIANYWHDRLGKTNVMLGANQREKILSLIRGDFLLVPSLKARIRMAGEELLRLTEEQFRILDSMQDNERVLVNGGAGTGKTLLAIEEARRRGEAGEKVLFVCFNRNLGAFIKEAFQDLPNVSAGTLHSFMYSKICEAGIESKLPPAEESFLFGTFYPQFSVEALLELDQLESFDSLIIDEAQDLITESFFEVFDAALKGGLSSGRWIMFRDPNQSVFSNYDPKVLQKLEAINPAKFKLTINCRNTSPIAVMTHLLSGISCSPTLGVEGPEVVNHFYGSESEQLEMIKNALGRLLGAGVEQKDIVILGRKKLANSILREGIPGFHSAIEKYESMQGNGTSLKYSTVKSYKGLEADCILFVDIEDLESADALHETYVGGTRANAFLEVFIDKNIKDQYEERAKQFGKSLLNI